jgi:hypothetical protein
MRSMRSMQGGLITRCREPPQGPGWEIQSHSPCSHPPIYEKRGFAVSQQTSCLLLQKAYASTKQGFMMIAHERRVQLTFVTF